MWAVGLGVLPAETNPAVGDGLCSPSKNLVPEVSIPIQTRFHVRHLATIVAVIDDPSVTIVSVMSIDNGFLVSHELTKLLWVC